ncbi:MAG TPA: hypothetical protein VFT22_38320 [Kofleriaceae bacterium]|nr:hypothetical protein [Kofleriaceae bacterium]
MVCTRAAVLVTATLLGVQSVAAAQRPERFPFEIQNGRGPDGLVFSVPAPGAPWTRSIRIAGAGDGPINTASLRLPDKILVETDAGAATELTAGPLPPGQDLPPGASLVVALQGKFPAAGTYKGEIVLLLASTPVRQRVVPIQITVGPGGAPPLPPMPIEDHSAKSVAVTESITGGGSTVLAIRLRNATTESLTVSPAFSTVVRVDKADAPSVQIAVPEAHTDGTPVVLGPGAYQPFNLAIDRLDAPGIYSVETVFKDASDTPKYQAQTIKTIVYRRQSWLWAAIAIALGSVLAWWARWFLSDGSRRLALRRRVALLGEHVRAVRLEAGSEQLISAARLLELDVADRDRDARWGLRVSDVEPVVARAEKRLELLRSVVAAFATLARLDADKQGEPRKKLDDALVVVRVDPGDDQKVSAAQDAVNAIAPRALWRDQLAAQLVELRALIGQQKQVGSAELVTALAPIENSLALADGQIRSDALEELGPLLDDALGKVLDACAGELTRLAKGPPPPGVDPADWTTAAAEVIAALPAAAGSRKERNAALVEAQKRYFTAAVGGLVKLARAKSASGDSRAAELAAMATDLETKLAANVLEAAAMYSPGLRKVQSPDPHVLTRAAVGFGPAVTPPAGWAPLQLGEVHSASAPEPMKPARSVALDRELTTTTWLVNGVVMVIAVLSGLKALWLDDLAWGGTTTWVAAFLWGAGVQAVGDTFTGLAGLRAKLSAAAPP